MDITQLIINLAGVALIAWIVWYFWLYRKEGIQVAEVAGVQQVPITVKGGYDPDVIVVKRGKPVRLLFNRQESSMCSEMVIFDKINRPSCLKGKRFPSNSRQERPVKSPSSARWACCAAR